MIEPAYCNVYPQQSPHQPAQLLATAAGLRALRDAIDVALVDGVARADVFASDGEGYSLVVRCKPMTAGEYNGQVTYEFDAKPFYVDEVSRAGFAGAETDELRLERDIERILSGWRESPPSWREDVAVNWARVYCYDLVRAVDGRWIIFIAKAAPDAAEFARRLGDELAKRCWANTHIVTEW